MSWVRLDDDFPSHPKVAALNDREFRVHVRALCYAAKYKTQGELPDAAFNEIPGLTRQFAKRLVEIGLWDEYAGQYSLHDFGEYNPRDPAAAERARKYREKRQRNGDDPQDF